MVATPVRLHRRAPGSSAADHPGTEPMMTLQSELLRLARDAGLDAVGVTTAQAFDDARRHLEERKAAGLHGGMHFTFGDPERSTDPRRILAGARSLVVGALSYRRVDPATDGDPSDAGDDGAASTSTPWARVARYSWRDHYEDLRGALTVVAERLRRDGWQARVVCDDNALVDRAAAVRAGLGWYGRNSLVLLPGLGSWFVLGSVVTDAALDPTGPVLEPASGCGPCFRCAPACPTGAIVAPGVIDARRCLAWLLEAPGSFPAEHRRALGARLYGCDECQRVCPVNRRADRDHPPPAPGDGEEPAVDVLEVLASSDTELLRRFGRWYIPRRRAAYVRRNALVVLGNVGDGDSPGVAAALQRALADPDPMIRSHGVWAAAQLGRRDLLGSVRSREDHPEVRAELEAVGG